MKHYCEDVDLVLREVGSTEDGLSPEEAARRLEQNGKNKLAEGKKDSLLKRFIDHIHSKGLFFELHSCGQVESLVPVMIECGVDLWNGQDMNDKVKMAQMYGDKIIVDSHPEYLSADATEEEAAANIQKYLDKFAGLRTYANRMGGHPKDNELIYALSRQMLNP